MDDFVVLESEMDFVLHKLNRMYDADSTSILEAISLLQSYGVATSLDIENILSKTKFRNLV